MSSSTNMQSKNNNGDESNAAWESLRLHILSCPGVNREHPAVQAALQGMDRELQRRQRDAKLQQKFTSTTTATTHAPETNEFETVLRPNEEKNEANNNNNPMEEDDWQTVPATTQQQQQEEQQQQAEDLVSPVGSQLAQSAVQLLAEHQIQVSSTVAAFAVVFHAVVLSTKDWECTGIPESKPSNGFAPPIRPISTFLPAQWNPTKQTDAVIRLRYRPKKPMSSLPSSVVLTVQPSSDKSAVKVVWQPQNAEPTELYVAVAEHVNLESWNKATRQSTVAASPCLHYKALAVLLSRWIQQTAPNLFILAGDIETSASALYREAAMEALPSYRTTATATQAPGFSTQPQPVLPSQPGRGYPIPTTIQDAFPGLVLPGQSRGQFSGDLLPGGGFPAGGFPQHYGGGIGGDMGNLMGPNHPAFGGGGGGHYPMDPNDMGGFLRPRFDPLGPPPTQPNLTPGGPARRPGEIPNPDHLRPPNNLNNNNMFL